MRPGAPVVAIGCCRSLNLRVRVDRSCRADVTELALANALERLVNLIEELRADADLHVEITTDETDLVKLAFSGTPSVGFPLRREVRDIPAEVVRQVWNESLRDYETA